MDGEASPSILQELLTFIKANILVSGLFFAGIILLGIGLMQYFNQPKDAIKFTSEEVQGANTAELFIDVSGAVQKPGVYKLPGNARTQDALIAAGGFSADADRDYVSKSMNLAAPLTDGMKLYIPAVGEVVSARSNSGIILGSNSGLISINSASSSELESLPGIGPVTAGKIIDNRPYSSIDELLSRKIVGKSTFEKIQNSVGL